MPTPSISIEEAIEHLQQAQRLGKEILAIPLELQSSDDILTAMETRAGVLASVLSVYAGQAAKAFGQNGHFVPNHPLADERVQRLVQGITEQNEQLYEKLQHHADLIWHQVEDADSAMKASRSYVNSDYLKSVARGLEIDRSL